jgi:GntR family transcriptional regulator
MTRHIAAPKSERIAHLLERSIRSGALGSGDALESESVLVRRYAVSRGTIRRSLELLAAKGLITTRSGVGSFVTYGGNAIDGVSGWSVALSGHDSRIETRVLRLERAAMDLAGAPVAEGSDCLCLDRLRLCGDTGTGLSLERSRVPWRAALEGLPEAGLKDGSLNRTLEAAGLAAASGEEWAGVLAALPRADADRMGRREGEPMLHLRRVTRDATGDVIEYVESVLDPARFGLHVAF